MFIKPAVYKYAVRDWHNSSAAKVLILHVCGLGGQLRMAQGFGTLRMWET